MIVEIGNKDNMGRNNPGNRKRACKVLENFYKDFEKNYPQLKIIGAVIHMDEATPHLHLTIAPYAINNGKNGLKHKQAWDEAYYQMGFKPEHSLLNKKEKKPIVFNGWRNHATRLLDEAMNVEGFEREDQYVTHDHMKVRDYKEWSDLKNKQQKELKEINNKIEKQKENFAVLIAQGKADVEIEVEAYREREMKKAEEEVKEKKQQQEKIIAENEEKINNQDKQLNEHLQLENKNLREDLSLKNRLIAVLIRGKVGLHVLVDRIFHHNIPEDVKEEIDKIEDPEYAIRDNNKALNEGMQEIEDEHWQQLQQEQKQKDDEEEEWG